MRTNEILATIPNGASATARPDTALEIAVELPQPDEPNGQADEQPSIAFRRLTWGSGLGLVSAANPDPDSGGSRGRAQGITEESAQMAGRLCRTPGQSHPFSGLTLNLIRFPRPGPLPFPLGGGGPSLSGLNTPGKHGPCPSLLTVSVLLCRPGRVQKVSSLKVENHGDRGNSPVVIIGTRPCPNAGLAIFRIIRLAVTSSLARRFPRLGCTDLALPVLPAVGGRVPIRWFWLAAMKMERITGM